MGGGVVRERRAKGRTRGRRGLRKEHWGCPDSPLGNPRGGTGYHDLARTLSPGGIYESYKSVQPFVAHGVPAIPPPHAHLPAPTERPDPDA
jgi:hypothetical protein